MTKKLIHLLLVSLMAIATSLPASAAMVGTAQIQATEAPSMLANIGGQRDWIREQLITGGVDSAMAGQRVAAMTDAQVLAIHQRIDESPAGGNSTLVIILLILVITEVMGYTDIVPGWPAQ